MTVSVIIPTFNRKHSLIRCLKSMPPDVEVIVIDDGSSDGTDEAIKRLDHPHLVYTHQENAGPASARNRGIDLASGDYIAFTDDDCIPMSDWPWPLVHRLEQEGPDVAGAGGKVIPLRQGMLSRYYTYHRILEPPESCSYLVTANCAYRSDLIRLVGGFDIGIRQPGGEDPGLSFAIRAQGFRLVFEPDATIMHDYRESLRDFIKTFYRYGKGSARATDSKESRLLGYNELMPPPLTVGNIKNEIKYAWHRYVSTQLPMSERFKFLFLILLQRFSYNMGWNKVALRQEIETAN